MGGSSLTLKVFMNRDMRSAEDRILDAGFEDILILKNFSYDSALVGISDDGRAIYDFEKMVEWLMLSEGFKEDEAIDWVCYNTLRAIPYMGNKAPIVMHRLLD